MLVHFVIYCTSKWSISNVVDHKYLFNLQIIYLKHLKTSKVHIKLEFVFIRP